MKRNTVKIVIGIVMIIAIFLPGFSKLQEIRSKNEKLEKDIARLQQENAALEEEIDKLNNDPVYLESIAREKMGLARKGEVIYKIVPEK